LKHFKELGYIIYIYITVFRGEFVYIAKVKHPIITDKFLNQGTND